MNVVVNNAKEFIAVEGYDTLYSMGEKLNHAPDYILWIGLQPLDNTETLWNDQVSEGSNKESTLDLVWNGVEVMAMNNNTKETEPIVLVFPFNYNAFLNAVDDSIKKL